MDVWSLRKTQTTQKIQINEYESPIYEQKFEYEKFF